MRITYNENNLTDKDINNVIKRAKIIAINSDDEILIAKCHGNYFFVGGRVEVNESDIDCLVRETKEEMGIDINIKKLKHFFTIEYYVSDYPEPNINTKSTINYYIIKENMVPNLKKLELTDDEKYGQFKTYYFNKNKIIDVLEKSFIETGSKATSDAINVIKEYLKEEINEKISN